MSVMLPEGLGKTSVVSSQQGVVEVLSSGGGMIPVDLINLHIYL